MVRRDNAPARTSRLGKWQADGSAVGEVCDDGGVDGVGEEGAETGSPSFETKGLEV